MAGTMAAMPIRYPAPLRPGDRIGVTSPSSGVSADLWPRFLFAAECLRDRVSRSSWASQPHGAARPSTSAAPGSSAPRAAWRCCSTRRSAPSCRRGAARRASTCSTCSTSSGRRCRADVVRRVLRHLDLADPAHPVTGVATVHGQNLMDTPYAVPDGIRHWVDVASTPAPGSTLAQRSPGASGPPGTTTTRATHGRADYTLDGRGRGCASTPGRDRAGQPSPVASWPAASRCSASVAGTPFGDLGAFVGQHARRWRRAPARRRRVGRARHLPQPCTACASRLVRRLERHPRRRTTRAGTARPQPCTPPSSMPSGCSAFRSSPTSSAATCRPTSRCSYRAP